MSIQIIPLTATTAPDLIVDRLDTKFLLLSGPFGSGKTTALNSILNRYASSLGKTCVVVNDFGEINIDASRIKTDQIIALGHECICCTSRQELKDTLRRVYGRYDTVLVEPTGAASPFTLVTAFSELKLDLRVLGLIDAEHLADNDEDGLQAETVSAADVLMITWADEQSLRSNCLPVFVREYVEELRGSVDVPLMFVSPGEIPHDVFEHLMFKVDSKSSSLQLPTSHIRKHNYSRFTVHLYSDTTIDLISSSLKPYGKCILRAKGFCSDGSFDLVHGELKITGESQLVNPGKMIIIAKPGSISADQLLTLGLPMLLEDDKIERLKDRYPGVKYFANRQGALSAHFEEGDVFYSKWYPVRNNLSIIPNQDLRMQAYQYWQKVLAVYLDYRLEAIAFASNNNCASASFSREVGLTLAWHLIHYSDDISADQKHRIRNVCPGALFITGCNNIQIQADLFGHRTLTDSVVGELIEMAEYAMTIDSVQPVEVINALYNCKSLAGDNWDNALFSKVLARFT